MKDLQIIQLIDKQINLNNKLVLHSKDHRTRVKSEQQKVEPQNLQRYSNILHLSQANLQE